MSFGREHNRRASRGFTLIEVMVVAAIIGTLAAMSIPAFTRMIHRGTLRSEGRQLYAALLDAQGRAVSNGQYTRVEITTTGANTGWKIVANCAGDGTGGNVVQKHFFLDSAPYLGFGPASGYPGTLVQPYDQTLHNSACTPCAGSVGNVVFDSDGAISQPTAGLATSQGSVVLQDASGKLSSTASVAVVFFAQTGSIKLFESQ